MIDLTVNIDFSREWSAIMFVERLFQSRLCRTLLGIAGLSAITMASACHHNHYYIDGQFGFGLNSIKEDTYFAHPLPNPDDIPPTRLDTYAGADTLIDFGLRGGMMHDLSKSWSLAWGLGLYATTPQTLTGKTQTIVGPPWDASYQYSINSTRLMLETRMYFHQNHALSYFYGFGVGVGHIRTSALTYTKIDSGFVAPKTNIVTQNHLVYAASVGADFALNNHWHLEGTVSKLWLGMNKIYVNMGDDDGFKVNQGDMTPWKFSGSLSYRF